MRRIIDLALLPLLLVACGGSDDPTAPNSDVELGTSANPASQGQPVTRTLEGIIWGRGQVELTLTDVIRGAAAWQIVLDGNQFNDEVAAGEEYVLAKFRVRIVAIEGDDPIEINNTRFDLLEDGVAIDRSVSVIGVEPDLSSEFFAVGAIHEGFTYFVARTSTVSALAIFDSGFVGEAFFRLW